MDKELMLDGNAVGGLLGEIFGREMTTVRGACATCGGIDHVGGTQVYAHAPGAVVRCRYCQGLLMVVTRAEGKYVLGLPGFKWIEFPD